MMVDHAALVQIEHTDGLHRGQEDLLVVVVLGGVGVTGLAVGGCGVVSGSRRHGALLDLEQRYVNIMWETKAR